MSLKTPDDMSPEQLAQALKNCHILETWILAVKSHAFEVLKNGGTIPGYKLGYGRKKRIWKHGAIEGAIKMLNDLGFTRDDIFTQPEILSPPKVQKLLQERSLWPRKKRGEARPKTPLDAYIDYSMPEPRVMPVDEHDESEDRLSDAEREFG